MNAKEPQSVADVDHRAIASIQSDRVKHKKPVPQGTGQTVVPPYFTAFSGLL
jgi:hypothetical protein